MNDDFRDEPSRLSLDGRFAGDHPDTLLPALANGALDQLTAARVRTHLSTCPRCQRELTEWQSVGAAVRDVTMRRVYRVRQFSPGRSRRLRETANCIRGKSGSK